MFLRGMLKRCVCCAAAAAVTAALFSAVQNGSELRSSAAPESENYEQRLAELDREQAELDEKLSAAESRAGAEKDKLDAVAAKLKSLKSEQSELEELSTALISEMVETDADLREVTHQLEEQENAIRGEVKNYSARLRALYLAGTGSYADIILTSEDFFDVLMRTELIKRVAGHDRETVDRMLEKLREIQTKKDEVEKKSEELKAKTGEFSERRQQLEKSIEEQDSLTEKYSAELEKAGMLTDELAEQSRRIESERAEVSSKAAEATTTTTTTTTTTPKATTTKKTSASQTESSTETTAVTTSVTKAPEETVTEAPKTTTTAATKATTTTTTTTSAPAPANDRAAKIKKVLDYALSNVGGTYVWGGASFRACDCSGLTMLAYAQIGINIPHWTVTQCQEGWAVSYSDLQPGDLVFFGGSTYSSVYHAAMYIGNGQIVHAENSRTGIVISDLARFSIYNHIAFLRRLI